MANIVAYGPKVIILSLYNWHHIGTYFQHICVDTDYISLLLCKYLYCAQNLILENVHLWQKYFTFFNFWTVRSLKSIVFLRLHRWLVQETWWLLRLLSLWVVLFQHALVVTFCYILFSFRDVMTLSHPWISQLTIHGWNELFYPGLNTFSHTISEVCNIDTFALFGCCTHWCCMIYNIEYHIHTRIK